MPKFSTTSLDKLNSCHKNLEDIFFEVIQHVDCSIIEGHRPERRQIELYARGRDFNGLIVRPNEVVTKVKWPNSKHNNNPSKAIDVVPYPIDWTDYKRFYLFAGFVLGIAKSMNINLTWGGDWNGNFKWDDQSFHDLPHFELKD